MTSGPPILAMIFTASLLAAGSASAQTVGPDETLRPDGGVSQHVVLTPAQRSAIYNAVIGERVRTFGPRMIASIGAPVPPSVALRDLPDQVAPDNDGAGLKYAMVEDDIVVVDPIKMRVVDVIHRGAKP